MCPLSSLFVPGQKTSAQDVVVVAHGSAPIIEFVRLAALRHLPPRGVAREETAP